MDDMFYKKVKTPAPLMVNGEQVCTFKQFVEFLFDSDQNTNASFEAAEQAQRVIDCVANDSPIDQIDYEKLLALALKPPKGYPAVQSQKIGTFSLGRHLVPFVKSIIDAENVRMSDMLMPDLPVEAVDLKNTVAVLDDGEKVQEK